MADTEFSLELMPNGKGGYIADCPQISSAENLRLYLQTETEE
jgi:hypothetical protein